MPDRSSTHEIFVDLEIRIFQRQEKGYPVEVTMGGQQEYPRGYLSPDLLPWVGTNDSTADGQRLLQSA
jgi:hypothetical protein